MFKNRKNLRILVPLFLVVFSQLACKTNADGTVNFNGDFETGFGALVGIVCIFLFCLFLVAVPALMNRK